MMNITTYSADGNKTAYISNDVIFVTKLNTFL